MDEDPGFDGGFSAAIARAFRELMNSIRQAPNENTLRLVKSYRFEKLRGKRSGECSMRLNDQYRLVLEIQQEDGGNRLVIKSIEDYH